MRRRGFEPPNPFGTATSTLRLCPLGDLRNTFFLRERTGAKKEYVSFGKAFLPKKRFVLKEKFFLVRWQISFRITNPPLLFYLPLLLLPARLFPSPHPTSLLRFPHALFLFYKAMRKRQNSCLLLSVLL